MPTIHQCLLHWSGGSLAFNATFSPSCYYAGALLRGFTGSSDIRGTWLWAGLWHGWKHAILGLILCMWKTVCYLLRFKQCRCILTLCRCWAKNLVVSLFGVSFCYMWVPCSDELRPWCDRTAEGRVQAHGCGSVCSALWSLTAVSANFIILWAAFVFIYLLCFFSFFTLLVAHVALSGKNCMQFMHAYSSICFIYWVYRDGTDSWINLNSKLLLYLHAVCRFFF